MVGVVRVCDDAAAPDLVLRGAELDYLSVSFECFADHQTRQIAEIVLKEDDTQ